MTTRFATLAQWLAWQQTLHPQAIDLGLARVRTVARRMGLEQPPYRIISVGGTNGKGSCVAFLEAVLRASDYLVGAYTSPHLIRYNERIRVAGKEIADAALCQAFARIDEARGDISLTYFEFGTLAALEIFRVAQVEVAVLEVGLGGRLDAVNVMDADAALITAIGIDHVEWLGPDRASISFEKAGIFRADRPAICADPDPPDPLVNHAKAIGALLIRVNQDYQFAFHGEYWDWQYGDIRYDNLPLPNMRGAHQIGNAAAVLMTLAALKNVLPVTHEAILSGLRQAHTAGRFQIFSGPVEWILDVAHNAHAASVLAQELRKRRSAGQTRVVIGILADKDAAALAAALKDIADIWYPATLTGPRGQTGEQLALTLRTVAGCHQITAYSSVVEACGCAAEQSQPGDRIVVCGSFYAVAEVMQSPSFGDQFFSSASGGL